MIQISFEPFKQLESNEANHGGTGLGLAITRQLVKALGGTITVQSDYGKWSEFIVTLPCKYPMIHLQVDHDTGERSESEQRKPSAITTTDEDDSTSESSFNSDDSSSYNLSTASFQGILEQAAKRQCQTKTMNPEESTISLTNDKSTVSLDSYLTTSSHGSSLSNSKVLDCPSTLQTLHSSTKEDTKEYFQNIRILIAEDNVINQKVLHRTLNRIGVETIDIVDNGKKAVEASNDKTYDICFMDMQMPVMDGLEACRIISKRSSRPKIIFLTAHALTQYQQQADDAGGDGFISKPFKIDVIKDLLASIVSGNGRISN